MRVVIGSLLFVLSITVFAQQKTETASVTRHVYVPAKLEPTEERVAQLKLPAGFRIAKFAELSNPRMIVVAPGGTIYVSQRDAGTVVMLRDTNNDGVADVQKVVAEKKMVHGLAIHNGKLYFTTVKELFVADVKPDGTLGEPQLLVNDLPDGGQHPNRTLGFGPDGMLYITVGSTCNACREPNDEHATILRFNVQSKERTIFAKGLRNTLGFGWHPASKQMYGMDHGIDWLGDDQQEEELNALVEGAQYGWPYVYAKSQMVAHPQPPKEYTKDMWARSSKEPVLLYTPHAAPMQMVFYTGSQFPAEYKNDAFIAMRGSWNRQPPSGYEVARIRFDQSGRPQRIEPFLTGYLIKGGAPEGKDGQFGRPVGLAVARDGSLLVGDDTNGVIYRVSYGRSTQAQAATLPRALTSTLPGVQGKARLTVTSDAFRNNFSIPNEYSAYGQDISPALSWSGVPSEAKSLVLLLEDPDAVNPKPFVHWLAINIPPTITSLPRDIPKTEKATQLNGGIQGANNMSKLGYFGPRPPAGEPPHRYHFQVFALDTTLQLPSGFNRKALLDAMQGHVVAFGEIVGTFQREQAGPIAAK